MNSSSATLEKPLAALAPSSPPSPVVSSTVVRSRSRRPFLIAGAVAAAMAAGVAYWLHARQFESTDDAYLEGRVIPIAAKVDGYVQALNVDDNQRVGAGQVLAVIDARDFHASYTEAQAALAAAQARLDDAQAKLPVFQAEVDQAKAEVTAAQAAADFTRADAARYVALSDAAASEQDRQRTRSSNLEALARVAAARSGVAAALAHQGEAQEEIHVAAAEVDSAKARLLEPELNLGYTRVIAPQSGRIARRTVERGAYVKAGQALFAIVPDELWVVANFKETQLERMRPGQPVDIRVDAYPNLRIAGRVESIQPGTGSRFSLLPAENATGNFVKVVQRIPVKIRLDSQPTASGLELAPGMSVIPEVRLQ